MRHFPGTIAHIPDAATVANKWVTRTTAASQDYAQGVAQTPKDPTALAIAQGQRYISQVTAAFNSGKWANGLRRAGKQGWLDAVQSKGVQNFSTGVAAAQSKVAAAFAPLLQYEASAQSQIANMPNVSPQDRKNRMNAWFDLMSAYQSPV